MGSSDSDFLSLGLRLPIWKTRAALSGSPGWHCRAHNSLALGASLFPSQGRGGGLEGCL